MKPHLPASSKEETRIRFRIFTAVVLLVLGVLGARLAQMQLLDRETYAMEAEGNAIETKIIRPARGYLYDRNGQLLVDNKTTIDVTVSARYFDEANLPLVAELAGVPDSLVRAKWDEITERSTYQTAILLEDIPFQAFARLREQQYRLRGIAFEENQQRRYHGPPGAAHVLGYVKEISESQLAVMREQGYRLGDMVGQTGIETEYETVLRGRVGREFVLVNVHGMEVQPYEGGVHDVEPESGVGLRLTLDAPTQALAESLFVNKRGSAVMIDVNDGGIIAMASAPDYDPTLFNRSITQVEADYLYNNPDKPLLVRATQSFQPPGSTWKPFMASIALQEGLITENQTLFCGGGYVWGGRLYRCHGGSHGNIAVKEAIQRSCNTFFFRLMNDTINGKRMDLPTWQAWAHRFGFGVLAPIDFPQQGPGLIPDSAAFDRAYPAGWTSGYTVNLGIGQGYMGVSSLQLARYTAAVANAGTLVTPHLVHEQVDPATGEVRTPSFPRARQIPIDPENWAIVQRGMELVVEAGTGRRTQIPTVGEYPEITLAGKTGTAENPRGDDHSVFIAYAPTDDPQVAVGVIVENGGFGSQAAAPIASLMIEQYLRGTIMREGMVASTRARRSGSDRG
ncbi:MAG: penicillin-binding protein 2 [Rhodothermaceae bacterium]|nr:penicillin-binding protein 2 [Rhodothermaceae bacterium]